MDKRRRGDVDGDIDGCAMAWSKFSHFLVIVASPAPSQEPIGLCKSKGMLLIY